MRRIKQASLIAEGFCFKNVSALLYFWIFRELQAIDSKESQILYNRQRNHYNRGAGEELKNSEHVF